jgi:hypothetical protein
MKRTGKAKRPKKNDTPFACPIRETTDLGLAMLIIEDDAGGYEPIGVVATLSEAREIAEGDFRIRLEELERGGSPMAPAIYKVFARGIDGFHHEAGRFSL